MVTSIGFHGVSTLNPKVPICQGNPQSISHRISLSPRVKFHMFIFPHGIAWGMIPGPLFCTIAVTFRGCTIFVCNQPLRPTQPPKLTVSQMLPPVSLFPRTAFTDYHPDRFF